MIISLGGSVINPNLLDIYAIKYFGDTIKKIDERAIIVVGGGSLARQYINSILIEKKESLSKVKERLDRIGILATIINAELVSILTNIDVIHPYIISMKKAISIIKRHKRIISSGWKPGFSTDYVSSYIASKLKEKMIINITKVGGVYTKDPTKYLDAKLIKELLWDEFLEMFDEDWFPGKNIPFDYNAAVLCKAKKMRVLITNLEGFEKFIKNKEIVGTLIR
ncbi:MAG: UMP kinase [Candidatus Woesearchaeota archaeon]